MMTPRQQQVHDYLLKYWSEHGQSPGYRTIIADLGMTSTSNAHQIVRRLEERGAVRVVRYTHGVRCCRAMIIPIIHGKVIPAAAHRPTERFKRAAMR